MPMRITIAWISSRRGKSKLRGVAELCDEYLARLSRFAPTEARDFASEGALLKLAKEQGGMLILLDQRGKQFSSEEWAEFIARQRDQGTQRLLFAIGGPDGFTPAALKAAALNLSLGRITLAHEIARVVLLEQLYRAFTIIHGHPYHGGH